MAIGNPGAAIQSMYSMGSMFTGQAPAAQPASTPIMPVVTGEDAGEIYAQPFMENNATLMIQLSQRTNVLLTDLGAQMAEMNLHLRSVKTTNRDIKNNTA